MRIRYYAGFGALPTLRSGDVGTDVFKLQEMLNALGYNVSMTGQFDSVTTIAVKDFQAKNGLNPDGVVGPLTWGRINPVLGGGTTGKVPVVKAPAVVSVEKLSTNPIVSWISDPVNLGAVLVGGGLLAYFLFSGSSKSES